MPIKLEKIQSTKSGSWFRQTGEEPRDYKSIGIHHTRQIDSSDSLQSALEEFASKVPDKAVIVLDYTPLCTQTEVIMSGVAYIPRKTKYVAGQPA